MWFYYEITLLPNPEVSLNFLWPKVYQQIHLGLVEMQDDQGHVPIGVSFPNYVINEKHCKLGNKLRLFAQDEATLIRFDTTKWLSRLSDYVHCTSIRNVPDKIQEYATYQRVQPKTNKERLARRYANRHNVDYGTALQRYSEMTHKSVPTPFVRLTSLSNNQTFCLWIKKTLVSTPSGSTYNSYGLSAKTSVPGF